MANDNDSDSDSDSGPEVMGNDNRENDDHRSKELTQSKLTLGKTKITWQK